MTTKAILVSALVALIGVAVVGKIVSKQSAPQETARTSPAQLTMPGPPAAAPASASTPALLKQTSDLATNTPSSQGMKADTALPVISAPTQTSKPKEPLHDPEARTALSLVGVDPEAEAYWLGAIFDSSLPENEREDLMEDLNEEGLSDKKHPGPQDLPVILNRLVLIEEILPFADEFMVEHLGEAYKDLFNLANITQGGGEPVP